jgi:uncharacterized protein YdaU (DUF1376 family)
MHSFPLHLGDYARDTSHLSLLEHGAYFALLRRYYSTGQALPPDLAQVQRLAGARSEPEREAVAAVLGEFFTLTPAGYVNAKAEAVLADYRAACERNRANGARGGRPRKGGGEPAEKPTGNPPGSGPVSEREPSGNPDGSDSETETKGYLLPLSASQLPNGEVGGGGDAPALALEGGQEPQAVAYLATIAGKVAVTDEQLERWRLAFPAVNVAAALRRMDAWLHDNPKRRPTPQGAARFAGNWLARAQDQAAARGEPAGAQRVPGFVPRVVGLPNRAEAREERNAALAADWVGAGA